MGFLKENIDAVLHAVIASLAVAFLAVAPFTAAMLVTLFFVAREVYQDYKKGYKFPSIWPIRRSTNKDREALFPFVAAYSTAFLITIFS